MRAPIIDGAIHQLEDFAAESLDIALFRRELAEVGGVPGSGAVGRITGSYDKSNCKTDAP
jgi:hypothetical protein